MKQQRQDELRKALGPMPGAKSKVISVAGRTRSEVQRAQHAMGLVRKGKSIQEAVDAQRAYEAREKQERDAAQHRMARQKLDRRLQPLKEKHGRRLKSIYGGKPGKGGAGSTA